MNVTVVRLSKFSVNYHLISMEEKLANKGAMDNDPSLKNNVTIYLLNLRKTLKSKDSYSKENTVKNILPGTTRDVWLAYIEYIIRQRDCTSEDDTDPTIPTLSTFYFVIYALIAASDALYCPALVSVAVIISPVPGRR